RGVDHVMTLERLIDDLPRARVEVDVPCKHVRNACTPWAVVAAVLEAGVDVGANFFERLAGGEQLADTQHHGDIARGTFGIPASGLEGSSPVEESIAIHEAGEAVRSGMHLRETLGAVYVDCRARPQMVRCS